MRAVLQSLEYFWALQRISLATLDERAFEAIVQCFEDAMLVLQHRSSCPISDAQPEGIVLVTVATALHCQLTTLAPSTQAPRASNVLLGLVNALPRFYHAGSLPFSSLDATYFSDAVRRAADADTCVATQLLLAYISHECHATIIWLHVSRC